MPAENPAELFILPSPYLEYPTGTRLTPMLWSLIQTLGQNFDEFTARVKAFFRTPYLSDLDFLDEPGHIAPQYIEDLLSTYREGLHSLLSIGTLASYRIAQQRVEELKLEQGRCELLWTTFKDGISSIPHHLRHPLDHLKAKISAIAGVIHSAQALGIDTLALWRYNGGPDVDKILTEVRVQNLCFRSWLANSLSPSI